MDTTAKQIIDILVKHNADYYEPNEVTYNGIVIYSITFNGNNEIEFEGCADDNQVLTDETALKILLNEVKRVFQEIHIWEIPVEGIAVLLNSIVWNSIYYADYSNDFGINEKEVCDFCDGFLSNLEELFGDWELVMRYLHDTDNSKVAEEFFAYIQSVEVA